MPSEFCVRIGDKDFRWLGGGGVCDVLVPVGSEDKTKFVVVLVMVAGFRLGPLHRSNLA